MLTDLPQDPGIYVVTTATGSEYVFDLVEGTVTRTPGAHSHPDMHDGVRRLRSIVACSVGSSGFWTMRPDDPASDFYWQLTTPIVSIDESLA